MAIIHIQANASSYAFFDDGNILVERMREYKKAINSVKGADYKKASEYRGYIVGVHDALSASGIICTTNVTKSQLGAVVVLYLKNNPEKWVKPAYYLVDDALKKAFPCNK